MSILVVRHGETVGNAARVIQRPDVPLNERGMRQAEALARRLMTSGFVHVLCSDLLRAQMTASALRRAGFEGEIEETPLLQERNFGDLRGTPYAELSADPFAPDFAPPNGETWPEFHARVAQAFALIVARRSELRGHLVVVTHGLVCGAIIERHAGVEPRAELERYHNTAVTVLEPNAPFAPSSVNCTEHLTGDLAVAAAGGAV
jgi:probable phosphoglycerate mutase